MEIYRNERLEEWFEDYVPSSGNADTVAGELLRAFARIKYRFYNDGDLIGRGYGKETCNPPARYLMLHSNDAIRDVIDGMWFECEYDCTYNVLLGVLGDCLEEYLDANPYLFKKSNEDDMWNYTEDSDYEDDFDDYDEWH